MNTTVICRDVRPGMGDQEACLLVAVSSGDSGEARSPGFVDFLKLSDVRAQLESREIVLGGSPPGGSSNHIPTSPRFPVQVTAQDDHGQEHQFLADSVEEYSLSSGSTLYYLHVPGVPADLRWLVGRTLEFRELWPVGMGKVPDPLAAPAGDPDGTR